MTRSDTVAHASIRGHSRGFCGAFLEGISHFFRLQSSANLEDFTRRCPLVGTGAFLVWFALSLFWPAHPVQASALPLEAANENP